jgi:hypothetical protein
MSFDRLGRGITHLIADGIARDLIERIRVRP